MIALDCKLSVNRAVNVLHPSLSSVLLWLLNIRIAQWKGRERRNHGPRSSQGKVQIPTLLVTSGNHGHSTGLEPTARVGQGKGAAWRSHLQTVTIWQLQVGFGSWQPYSPKSREIPTEFYSFRNYFTKSRCKKSNRSEVTGLANKGEALKGQEWDSEYNFWCIPIRSNIWK